MVLSDDGTLYRDQYAEQWDKAHQPHKKTCAWFVCW
jgi:hypothetical protein